VNENHVINENEKLTINNTTALFNKPCKKWVKVNRSCGGQLYLCADNYASAAELYESAIKFDEIQCKGLAPVDPGNGGIGKF